LWRFDALAWGSAETIEHTMNRPPALEAIFYARKKDALDARPTAVRSSPLRVIEGVRFAVDGKVKVPITDALRVGEQIRRNLMGSLSRIVGQDELSSTFSGKDSGGTPVRGHTHVSILSLDEDLDGFIDTVLIASPQPFSVAEQRAIDRLHPVRRPNGHAMVLTPIRYGTRDELMCRTTPVVSQTPFAPFRHWRLKRDGEENAWLTAQIAGECEQRGLPPVLGVRRVSLANATRRRARWLDFKRSRKDDSPQPAYRLQLTFSEPVLAPFSIGYASHFGLGTFVTLK
jgi:CRISPR-associated protein Csb2